MQREERERASKAAAEQEERQRKAEEARKSEQDPFNFMNNYNEGFRDHSAEGQWEAMKAQGRRETQIRLRKRANLSRKRRHEERKRRRRQKCTKNNAWSKSRRS